MADQTYSRLFKIGFVATICGLLAILLKQNDELRDLVAEKLKEVVVFVRKAPGLGYSGNSKKLSNMIDTRTLVEAEKDEAGYWKGAPSLEYDEKNDRLLLYLRHRNPNERGHTVSIYHVARETLEFHELLHVDKQELEARSIEGGALISRANGFIWYISYQSSDGDWRIQERRGSTLDELRTGGEDLEIDSDFFHQKDPVFIKGELYCISSTRYWSRSKIERINPNKKRAETAEIPVSGAGNARITTGGVLGWEIFTDVWPNLPYTNIQNFLWTTDERATTGCIGTDSVDLDPSKRFVSESGGSVTYIASESIDETVYLMWQEQREDRSNDLVGSKISIDEYRKLVT